MLKDIQSGFYYNLEQYPVDISLFLKMLIFKWRSIKKFPLVIQEKVTTQNIRDRP